MVKERISAAAILIGPDKKIVIVNQHGNNWSLPRGGLEANENEIDAAIREINEECGISKVTHIRKIGTYRRPQMAGLNEGDEPVLKIIHVHLFTTNEIKLKPYDQDITEAKWVTLEEAIEHFKFKPDKDFLKENVKYIK